MNIIVIAFLVLNINFASDWNSVLIDSSKNGYGAYNDTPNPLAYSLDNGWVAAYRQWGGIDATAGYIGVAQSEDGEDWFVEQRINTKYPEGAEEPSLPSADGNPQGRYPSAVVSSIQNRATAVWNEYTLATNGGGESGGRPMFVFDFLAIGENSNFSGTYNLNPGCGTFPCDPPDLWNGNVQLVDGDDGVARLYSLYTSWASDEYPSYGIKSSNVTNGYITPSEPAKILDPFNETDDTGDCLWYDCATGDGFSGTPAFDFNSEGVGYMAFTAYVADSTDHPYEHTLFFRKTEDFGENWTDDEGFKNSGYYFLSDSKLLSLSDSLLTMWTENPGLYPDMPFYKEATCTDDYDGTQYACGDTTTFSDDSSNFFWSPGMFLHYNYDLHTDQDGGLHFVTNAMPNLCREGVGDDPNGCLDLDNDGFADSLYSESRYGAAGMYHFYNPDPIDDSDNWTLTFLMDISDANFADWIDNMAFQNSATNNAMYFLYPQISPSGEEGSSTLWFAGSNMSDANYNSDSSLYVANDIDIYMSKSIDNGKTWAELENVTNTPFESGIVPVYHLETGVHLANIGTDTEIGVFYQMPDFATETITPPTGYEDFKNRVYVGIYSEETVLGLEGDVRLPNKFILSQNYPNPFNPITNINYSLGSNGAVNLKVFDIRGGLVRELLNEEMRAGQHQVSFDGSSLASGVYFYTMTVNNVSKTKKLVLMK